MSERGGEVREMRLALVCYGGVSLAIYMHGIAKEIQRLITASTAYDRDQTRNPFTPGSTEHAWWKLLDQQAAGGVRKRIVVDIVSGTSAGGINGICLAKGIASNRSQDGLTKVWLERGDLKLLFRGLRFLPLQLRAAWFGLDLASRPYAVKAPLSGDHMSQWLLEAFDAMDAGAPAFTDVDTLVPETQSIDLFVPVTDFHGRPRQVPIDSPKWIRDRSHRHVMKFRQDMTGTQFDNPHNAMLAFAARATSSFPGGFAATSLNSFGEAVGRDISSHTTTAEFFPHYELAHADPSDNWFVDGGVLDNAPFASSIQAISTKPADTEVDRRLLYIEPDPSVAAMQETGKPAVPSWPSTVWGGLAGIPRQEPIVDDLVALAQRNQDVRRVRDVIETSFSTIKSEVRTLLGVGAHLPAALEVAQVNELHERATATAAEKAGFGYATYVRLRVRSSVEGFANVVSRAAHFPNDSYQAAFVIEVLRSWAERSGLLEQSIGTTPAQRSFLEHLDIAYDERRIRFLISALNWWYRGGPSTPPRSELDSSKATLYRHLKTLQSIAPTLLECPSVAKAMLSIFDNHTITTALDNQESMADFVARHQELLDEMHLEIQAQIDHVLAPMIDTLHQDVLAMCRDWNDDERDDFLVRYLGFPFWDVLVFPVQNLSGVTERDAVEVARLSPRDVTLLSSPEESKLKGASFHHFGAFLTRPGRENDYLWGRLDAVERLVSLVVDDPTKPGLTPQDLSACKELFSCVLDEEESKLTHIKPTLVDLRNKVTALNENAT